MTAQALLLAATLRGTRTDEERARALVAPHVSQAMLTPLGAGGILQAFSSLARDHREIIVISDGPTELAEVARRNRVPGTLVLCLSPEQARSFLEVGLVCWKVVQKRRALSRMSVIEVHAFCP